mmetsp:Transcript_1700/g.4291  ORF Transcript_1700/g.4291 Transcript_1700/m.4291 type:complete len:215 (+) Transcript_1700:508-1152(+)
MGERGADACRGARRRAQRHRGDRGGIRPGPCQLRGLGAVPARGGEGQEGCGAHGAWCAALHKCAVHPRRYRVHLRGGGARQARTLRALRERLLAVARRLRDARRLAELPRVSFSHSQLSPHDLSCGAGQERGRIPRRVLSVAVCGAAGPSTSWGHSPRPLCQHVVRVFEVQGGREAGAPAAGRQGRQRPRAPRRQRHSAQRVGDALKGVLESKR